MDYRFLWILVAALLLIIVGLLLRMNLYKKQLHSFTEQLRFFRKEKKDGLISVESFGKDYIDLAKELQQFVDEEQELIEQSEKDRQSVKHMVAGISHDLSTPLTKIEGYASGIRDGLYYPCKRSVFPDCSCTASDES